MENKKGMSQLVMFIIVVIILIIVARYLGWI